MDFIVNLFSDAFARTILSFSHNWPYLLLGVATAGALKAFVDADRVSVFLRRHRRSGVFAATAAAVATPLCSCGTTAVVLGMMASSMPWAPIVAFMVASPLSSPEGIVYTAGLFGWPFALYYFAASILLGLAGGAAAAVLQEAGFLEGQLRFAAKAGPAASGCCASAAASVADPSPAPDPASRARVFAEAVLGAAKYLLPLFVGFAFLGYLINGIVPASAIEGLFGRGRAFGVPLAATIGLPLYISSEASVPLARSLLESGMSPGAVMAFLIAGSGTSLGAVGGALAIARRRVVGLVVAVLWLGAVAAGFGYDGLAAAGLFR